MRITQKIIAEHLGVTQQRVSQWLKSRGINPPYNLDEIRVSFIKSLSENAAGRAGSLAEERALLAKEQRIKVARENRVADGELIEQSEAHAFWAGEILRARARLLRLPREIAISVPKEVAIDCEQVTKRAVYEALDHLSEEDKKSEIQQIKQQKK